MENKFLKSYCTLALILFFTHSAFSQSPIVDENKRTPNGLLDNVFDNYGNHYTLNDIVVGPKISVIDGDILESTLLCTSGIFEIYIEKGSGMELPSNPNHIARRSVVCAVLADVSQFLETPIKNNTEKIKIWIRDFDEIPNRNSFGISYGTSYYNVPQNNTTANLSDNQFWKMVLSGKDSYSSISQDGMLGREKFYHATLAFDFEGNKWNTNLNSNATSKEYDFYSYVLREVVHSMGFSSLLSANGTSKLGDSYAYYSRFDSFLKTSNNQNLLDHNGCNGLMGYTFAGTASNLHDNCATPQNLSNCNTALQFGNSGVQLYTPNCYRTATSFNYSNENCNSNPNHYLMQKRLAKGETKRFLAPEERGILNSLGYSFGATYGTVAHLSYKNYNTTTSGLQVAGVTDGIAPNGAIIYRGNTNQPLVLPNLLANDRGVNLNLECLTDLTDATTTFSAVTANTTIPITMTSTQSGYHLLSYVPYNSVTSERGNITYVYVYLVNLCAVLPTDCNLVFNGDFEQYSALPTQRGQIERACNWYNAGGGSPSYHHRHAAPIGFINQSILVPGNPAGSPQEVNPTYGGDAYALVELFRYNDPNDPKNTGKQNLLATELAQPLLANTSYRLQFDVSRTEISTNAIAIQAYLGFNPISGHPPGDWGNYILEPNSILLDNSINNGNTFTTNATGWETITFNFTTGATAGQGFLFLCGYNNISYMNPFTLVSKTGYYIDNVKLIPIYNPLLNIQPKTFCANDPSLDLSTMLTGGVTGGFFSLDGVAITGTIFNPATTSVGTHTITYTIPLGISCPEIVVTDTIIVNSCLPAQPPYISQVYYNGADKFVEVKNADNTTAIATGMYYLALYENGATTGAPTSFVDLGAIPANGVNVFRANTTATPTYAVGGATIMPLLQNYDGIDDLLIITTTNGTNAYNDRIDILGDTTGNSVFYKNYTQQNYESLVRISCAPQVPRTDAYDEQDWVGFSAAEVAIATSKTNAVLGRHNSDLLTFEFTNIWNDLSLDESNPDRSRQIQLINDYDTSTYGDFEACSLTVGAFVTLTITPSHYVKVQINVTVDPNFGRLIVQNEGSLVMVRDCYYSVCGTNLINLGANSTLQANKQTVNLSGPYDYVYWSSPLSSNPSNPTAGQIFPFGLGTNLFDPSRFYRFENQNFCDILNIYFPLNGSTDGYDDNFDDYIPFTTLTTAANEQLIPGRGYASWPPVPAASNYNYNITFTGEMNNGVVSVPVFRNNSFSGRNSNLVGNPYPSPIDLDLFFSANTTTIENIAYIWTRLTDDPNAGIPGPNGLNYTAANFSVYTPDMSLNTESNPFFAGNNILASGQSFFVRTYKDFTGMTPANPIVTTSLSTPNGQQIAPAGNVLFNNSMRTTAPNITFSRTSTIIEGDKLWVNLTDSTNYTAQLGVYFKPTGHAGFVQNEDAPTIQGRKYNFYTQSTPEDLLIDVQDGFDTSKVIPLGMVNVSDNINQSFTISIPKKGGVFSSQIVYLEDTQLGILHNLSASNYTFTANTNIVEGRFNLRFTNNITTFTTKSSGLENGILLKVSNDTLFVSSSNKKIKSVHVFDIYTPNTSNSVLNKLENKNTNQVILPLQANTILFNVRIVLEDGTIINKKIKK